MKNCPSCGQPVKSDDIFCGNCGFDLKKTKSKPQKMTCPNCGAEIKPDYKFCLNCGYQLNQDDTIPKTSVFAPRDQAEKQPSESDEQAIPTEMTDQEKQEAKPASASASQVIPKPTEKVRMVTLTKFVPLVEHQTTEITKFIPVIDHQVTELTKFVPLTEQKNRHTPLTGEKHFCPNCGHKVAASYNFCLHCGFKLPGAVTASTKNQPARDEVKLFCPDCGRPLILKIK